MENRVKQMCADAVMPQTMCWSEGRENNIPVRVAVRTARVAVHVATIIRAGITSATSAASAISSAVRHGCCDGMLLFVGVLRFALAEMEAVNSWCLEVRKTISANEPAE